MSPTRIVIVGGGISGIDLATRIGRSHGRRGRAAVTLIDRNLAHVWKPMLHTFAAGTARPDREQVDFLAQAKRNQFTFIPGYLDGIDRATRTVSITPLGHRDASPPPPPLHLNYDRLVLAVGSRTNDFGTPGVTENCLTIDGLEGAQALHERLRQLALAAFRREEELNLAIVGGGATGVELAAELKHAVDRLAAYGSPSLPRRFRLALIESGPRLLPAFPDHVSKAAADTLRKLDVDVRLGAKVTSADAGGFTLDGGSRIEASIKIWAAGVRGPDVLDRVEGLERSRTGQLMVTPSLRTTKDPTILAIGDCASLMDPGTGRSVPATAQAAAQESQHLARHFEAWQGGDEAPPFRFRERGMIVSLADYNGWGTLGRVTFGGGHLKGLSARAAHALLYRQHQFGLFGPMRGALTWLVDGLDRLISPPVRLD
ncbi:NAD(P)/FAD-dependent oxidoreductase [Methylobacterium sp. J-077]|uniref:NAD(P)/FAD-dependent oxidoreductase n=1 Tax=Methylobacterium sp. J-077 TaxID=2836656 RepID=UPI001FB9628B|nr:NAD(P)/FAD-dependent oxidoreductase [Methylobacterium sp. J-077]MCJ2124962.1 NAD(P)/FAD-dependent oxidoreductase [Methylobacterium sp. J-077]